MTSSIDGLVSGLSTSSLISSLMKVEAAPQNRLQTKVSAAETVVTAHQSVNTKLKALKNAAAGLGQLDTWRAVKPTASSTAVTATAAGGVNGSAGSVAFDVKALAAADVKVARFPQAADVVMGDKTYGPQITAATDFTIQVGAGTPVTVTLGDDKSARGISDAINAKSAGVRATVLTTGAGEKILQLASTKTGEANAFVITGLDLVDPNAQTPMALSQETIAADALINVKVAGGYDLKSSTNTFTALMPGVTVTATKIEDGITLSTVTDVTGIAGKFQALVDAANATLAELDTQTAYNPATKKGSALTGDFMTRQIGMTLLSTISQGIGKLDPADAAGFGSLSQLGIELDRTGRLSFNAAQFTAEYNKDPDKIKSAGLKLADTFETSTTVLTANVTAAINGRKTLIDSMNTQIDNWGVRLTARQEALQKQYATLETSLSKLNSQSTWLSGQIASLG